MNAARRLADMFEADRDDPDWYERFRPYEIDAEIGAKPWWPPASEVWQRQGIPPEGDGSPCLAHYPRVWELLQGLHGDYLLAKEQ